MTRITRLKCPTCDRRRKVTQVRGFVYECQLCQTSINVWDQAAARTKARAKKRKAKAKELGTYVSDAKRKAARLARSRELNPEYIQWLHGWGCIVPGCGTPWPIHAHHVDHKSQGGSDLRAIPLCPFHHLHEYHERLGSPAAASRAWGVDLDALILALLERYDAGQVGPYQARADRLELDSLTAD